MTIGFDRILSLLMPGPRAYLQGRIGYYEFDKMERELDDTLTNSAVKVAISRDPGLRTAGIHVATWCNVVQLSGFVESRDIIGKAIATARDVRGVSAVRNDMRLK